MAACAFCGALAFGCRQDMHKGPVYKPYRASDFFPDHRSARPLVAGTVAREHLPEDTPVTTGKVGQAFLATIPVPVTMDLLRRGQDRFGIFCSPCHGMTGAGDGMVARRGFRQPTSFHNDRMRRQPDGYVFDVMTSGFGAMPDYAAQVPVPDRWAIVAYIRALQLSQAATLADVPPEKRPELDQAPGAGGVGEQPPSGAGPQAGAPPGAQPEGHP